MTEIRKGGKKRRELGVGGGIKNTPKLFNKFTGSPERTLSFLPSWAGSGVLPS